VATVEYQQGRLAQRISRETDRARLAGGNPRLHRHHADRGFAAVVVGRSIRPEWKSDLTSDDPLQDGDKSDIVVPRLVIDNSVLFDSGMAL
jgi:hypothetical protein